MDDESKQMHVDSLNVQVFNHQPLKDSLPVIEHAGSSGKGFPYAPEDFPSPGDVWTWRVGKRHTHAGFWQDRSVHPPDRLQSSMGNKISFRGRASLEQYIRKTFPDADVDAFFASFAWKIPCTNVANDASLKAIKSKGCSKSAAIVQPGDCKASNEMCLIKAKTGSALTPATCNICCSEPNFCRNCSCILCSKTIDWIYDGYSWIKCEALVDEKFICGHVAHIECALRAYLAGKVGGSIDLDAQYYCRCCDNKTDLLLHVQKIIKVSESIDDRDDMVKVLNLGFCMLRGSEKERAEKLRNHIATLIEKLKHGVLSEDIWSKRSEISELEQGSQMGRSYYSDFSRYGGLGSSYDYRSYYPPHRESSREEEVRRRREEQELRVIEEEQEYTRERRREQGRRDDSSRKRKSEEDRSLRETEDASKRSKVTQPSSSSIPASGIQVDIHTDFPALPKADIQTIISRPSYTIPKAPAKLESQFPSWFLNGVRFDLDLTPIDKDSIPNNLDAVKQDVNRMHNWQKLVDELQKVNRCNYEVMLTMESDKAEWAKIMKEHNDEMSSITAHNEELEVKVTKLQEEMTASSTLHAQREELLKGQVREAHTAQAVAESKLYAEREKTTSQALKIATLQAKLAKIEQERDLAIAEKVAAEESHESTKAEVNANLFEFYVHSVMGRDSLSFLGLKYEVTLAEVWNRILELTRDDGYTEEELLDFYLSDEARDALARGKKQLAGESVIEPSEAIATHDRTLTATSTDAGTVAFGLLPTQPAAIESASTGAETHVLERASLEKKEESGDVQQYEIEAKSPKLSATSPDVGRTSPPLVITLPAAEATSILLSQPGPESEKIEALQSLDDPVTSQEIGGDIDIGGGEKTPDVPLSPSGTGSSTKRKKKVTVSKEKKHSSSGEQKNGEGSQGTQSRPGSFKSS